MEESRPDYHAFLLRLWQVHDDGARWRASLEDAVTHELHHFADIEALVAYLEARTRSETLDRAGES